MIWILMYDEATQNKYKWTFPLPIINLHHIIQSRLKDWRDKISFTQEEKKRDSFQWIWPYKHNIYYCNLSSGCHSIILHFFCHLVVFNRTSMTVHHTQVSRSAGRHIDQSRHYSNYRLKGNASRPFWDSLEGSKPTWPVKKIYYTMVVIPVWVFSVK